MRRLLAAILTFTLMLTLVACGGGGGGTNNGGDESTADDNPPINTGTDATSAESNTPADDTTTPADLGGTKINETKDVGDFTITVLSIVNSEGPEHYAPEEGRTYVFIKIALTNHGNELVKIDPLVNFTCVIDGESVPLALTAGIAVVNLGGETILKEVAPGQTVEGYYYLSPSVDAKALELIFDPHATIWEDGPDSASFTLSIPSR